MEENNSYAWVCALSKERLEAIKDELASAMSITLQLARDKYDALLLAETLSTFHCMLQYPDGYVGDDEYEHLLKFANMQAQKVMEAKKNQAK